MLINLDEAGIAIDIANGTSKLKSYLLALASVRRLERGKKKPVEM